MTERFQWDYYIPENKRVDESDKKIFSQNDDFSWNWKEFADYDINDTNEVAFSSEKSQEIKDTYNELIQSAKLWWAIDWVLIKDTLFFKSIESAYNILNTSKEVKLKTSNNLAELKKEIKPWDIVTWKDTIKLDVSNWNQSWCKDWVCNTNFTESNNSNIEQTWGNNETKEIIKETNIQSDFEVWNKWYVELNLNNYEQFLNQNNKVSLSFTNPPWTCPGCEQLKNTLIWNNNPFIAVTYNDEIMYKIIEKFWINISSVPRTIIFKNGQIVEDLGNIMNSNEIVLN
jgi:hypothetical protein